MRRTTPIIILVIGVLFLIVDFWPKLTLPNFGDPNRGSRAVETKLGLDLVGGLRVIYSLQPVGDRLPDAGALATTKSIIENRINTTGVAEPVVQTEGVDRVVVELPNAKNPDEIRALLVQTGKLDFVPLPPDKYGNSSAAGTNQAVDGQPLPTTEQPLFGGEQVDQAYPSTDEKGQRAVGFRLKSDGSRLFGDYTTKHVNEFFAIVLDGKVVSAPVIQSPITGGQGIITGGSAGGFSAKDMNSLITVLNYGSLPFPLKEESVTEIGATLAGFSLDRILLAELIAVMLVFLFMLVYYRVSRPDLLRAAGAGHLPDHPRHPDAGRDRRLRALDRHGGRRQHPDLRADEGGDPLREDAQLRDGGRLQPGLELHPGLERVHSHHRDDPVRLRVVHDPRLRAGPDHRRTRRDVHRGHGDPDEPALGGPQRLGPRATPVRTARRGVQGPHAPVRSPR